MKMNLKKGFTLIELLVVVAIIGILASVVLASLNTARNKGKDASVQSSMSSMRAQAELGVGSGGTYVDGLCASSATGGLSTLVAAATAAGAGSISCGQNSATGTAPSSWGVAAYLPTAGNTGVTVFCVDSTGFAGTKTGATGHTPGLEIHPNVSGAASTDVVCDAA